MPIILFCVQPAMMDQFTSDLRTSWINLGLPLKPTSAAGTNRFLNFFILFLTVIKHLLSSSIKWTKSRLALGDGLFVHGLNFVLQYFLTQKLHNSDPDPTLSHIVIKKLVFVVHFSELSYMLKGTVAREKLLN